MDPEEKLRSIKAEIAPWLGVMGRLADQVRDEDISRYPIFVVHPATVELGLPIVEKGERSRWSIHVSTLEEFHVKGLIQPERIDEFRRVYKDPDEQLCLFILSDLGAQFVFMPRR